MMDILTGIEGVAHSKLSDETMLKNKAITTIIHVLDVTLRPSMPSHKYLVSA